MPEVRRRPEVDRRVAPERPYGQVKLLRLSRLPSGHPESRVVGHDPARELLPRKSLDYGFSDQAALSLNAPQVHGFS